MKKSDGRLSDETNSVLHDAAARELELPDAPDFISKPSRRTLSEMLPLLEDFRQWPQVKKHLEPIERCLMEFVLQREG